MRREISVLGICDHDTTDALDTAIGISVHTPVDVLPGCELTCAEAGREYHLLAYCFEPSEDSFQRHLSRTRERRVRRCETMLERLRGEGVELSMDDVVIADAEDGYLVVARLPHQVVRREISVGTGGVRM
ncbi:MAG: PHP domain-containing protein [Candidatus Kapaibacterium sp.]